MKIFSTTKELVRTEKEYTAKILQNLMQIEKDKLYCELKYPSLYSYLIKELNYSEAESTVRVNAVRLMLKSKNAANKIIKGDITLSNAADAEKVLRKVKNEKLINKVIQVAQTSSNRKLNQFINTELERVRKEVLILDERTLDKIERVKKAYGEDLSSYEVIQILLEEKLKTPNASLRGQQGDRKSVV